MASKRIVTLKSLRVDDWLPQDRLRQTKNIENVHRLGLESDVMLVLSHAPCLNISGSHLVVEVVIQLQDAVFILRVMLIHILQQLDLIQALVHIILIVLQESNIFTG